MYRDYNPFVIADTVYKNAVKRKKIKFFLLLNPIQLFIKGQ